MELLTGNLYIILVLIFNFVFTLIWTKVYEGDFQMVFSYLRKQNFEYSYKVAGKWIGIVTVGCMMIYELLCLLLKYRGISVLKMLFIVPVLFFYYLMMVTGGTILMNRVQILGIVSSLVLMPFVVFGCILLFHIEFDKYIGYGFFIVLIIDIFMWKRTKEYWEKGDLS